MKYFVEKNEPRRVDVKQFELEEWVENSPFEELLGLSIESSVYGTARLRLPFTVKLANGGGVMHGGALSTLADTAVVMAMKSLLPVGTSFATVELSMNFLAPVLTGSVVAVAQVTARDKRLYDGSCELKDDEGQLVASSVSLFKVARKPR